MRLSAKQKRALRLIQQANNGGHGGYFETGRCKYFSPLTLHSLRKNKLIVFKCEMPGVFTEVWCTKAGKEINPT